MPRPLIATCFALTFASGLSAQGNVLLVIADDVGVDRIAAYGEHPSPGRTPQIDRLAERGVLFRNTWSNPICSPTRATILTGRHAFRTGVGTVVSMNFPFGLALSETTLAEVLAPTHTSVALGKWHLSSLEQGTDYPQSAGFAHHAGSLFNLQGNLSIPSPGPSSVFEYWLKHTDGIPEIVTTYATTDTIDDAVRAVRLLPEPWFLWVAFNDAHGPSHAPPPHLFTQPLTGTPASNPIGHHKAATEALDTELGRLLEHVDLETTHVIFVGDNGTQTWATEAPFVADHAKGTVYEGGINVPLIIAGPRVTQPDSECAALVQTTDLFDTIVELAGSTGHGQDSKSLVPYLDDPLRPTEREFVYAERFEPNGIGPYLLERRAMRGLRYKLIREAGSPDELYDLATDTLEGNDLLLMLPLSAEANAAYTELDEMMERLRRS